MFDIETALTCISLPDILLASIAIPTALTLGLLVRYLVDSHKIGSNGIPGPLLAKLSDAWLGWTAAHGHRSEIVHALHEKYGKLSSRYTIHTPLNILFGSHDLPLICIMIENRSICTPRTQPCLHQQYRSLTHHIHTWCQRGFKIRFLRRLPLRSTRNI